MQLTKQEFEEILDRKLDQKLDEKLNAKFAAHTIEFKTFVEDRLDSKLAIHTKEIKSFVVEHVDNKIDELAIMINRGFQNLHDQWNDRFPPQPWKNKQN